jgi:ribosomal protein S3
MKQVVATNRLSLLIGKKGKRVSGLLKEIARHFRRVHTYRHRMNANFFNFRQIVLNAP